MPGCRSVRQRRVETGHEHQQAEVEQVLVGDSPSILHDGAWLNMSSWARRGAWMSSLK
jgi:hypothetical protein